MTDQSESLSFIPTANIKCEEGEHNDAPKSKRGRIIVRNLPFKNLSEDKLKQWFIEYGDIQEVNLLRKDDGKFVGCGFVQFANVSSAAKAVLQANQKEVSGRKIIVDWAVPKNVYVENLKNIKQEIKQEPEDYDLESGNVLPYWEDTEPSYDLDGNNEANKNSVSDDSQDNETECAKFTVNKKENKKENSKMNTKEITKSNDVEEGKTLFVRNLPYSVTNDDLKKCFKKFGALEYALVCVDKLTEHSKGTGFVKFKEKSSAEKCLLENNKIIMEDNPLWLSLAVSKDNLKNNKKKMAKDSRNLYLAKEGVVVAGSVAAKGVSATDMAKRLEIEQWKSQMLKNLNMFVSDRRLIIHNLPSTYNESQLKSLFKKHTHPKVCISEARIMRDKKKIDGKTGLGLSKEYAFVTFSTHEDALLALRNLNNNPNIFSVKKRPIVAFSIESKVALNLKQKRLEKSRIKLGIESDSKNKLMKLNRKQRRFIKRRQKLIERRREAKMSKNESVNQEENVKKRKSADSENSIGENKKRRISERVEDKELDTREYCGLVSKPGTKVRLQSRFKLKNQARIHKQKLKEEKSVRKKSKKVKTESVKQPKQKQGKKHFSDDSRLNTLIKKRRKEFDSDAAFKKWDEK